MIIEKDILPSELKSIEYHRRDMAKELKEEVSIEEAADDFIRNYESAWCKEKTRRDNLEQYDEIKKHRWIKSEKEGHDMGKEAEEEWLSKYASIWREEKESLRKNGFLEKRVTIQNERGLHVRPSGTLVNIARKYDCNLYVHKEGMDHYNFIIGKKKYINVKSVLTDLLRLCAVRGDELYFIASGRQAKEALDEIEDIVKMRFGEE